MTAPGSHTPVLLDEVMNVLSPAKGKTYIDGTFGRGGYSKAILAACLECRVIAVDRDPDAVSAGRELEREHPNRFKIVQANFSEMEEVASSLDLDSVDGVALDVGVSSVQIDNVARGFSFQKDASLDMRMSKTGISAADVVNSSSEDKLSDIIFQYGEERRARRIAKEIVRQREDSPIETTVQLADLVERVVRRSPAKRHIHPATKTFQALRIFVNDELHELAFGLAAAERILADGGCLAVVTFHSLEDRLVKKFFAIRSGRQSGVSRHQPPHQELIEPSFQLAQSRAIKPSDAEIAANVRARSAKLRAARRTRAKALKLDLGELGIGNLPNKRIA